MANIRAIMKSYEPAVKDANGFYWDCVFSCIRFDGGAGILDVSVRVDVANSDSAATTNGKIIDAIVAAVLHHDPANVLQRTNVYLSTLTRGS